MKPALVLTTLVLVAAVRVPAQQLVLTDVTDAAGISWRQTDGFAWMGAGSSFLDYDGDGHLDVLAAGGFTTPTLFRNLGDGTFAPVATPPFFEVPPGTPIGIGLYTCCTTVGDVDGDGDPDVFFGRWGENRMFRNDGNGTFTDITTPEVAGLATAFTTTASFGDFDGDGALDLFVGNYIRDFMYPFHTPEPNVLLHGRGDGTFDDVTLATGTTGAGTALASTWSDTDGDGDVDLLCGNDFGSTIEPNRCYRNDGPGTNAWSFSERSAALGLDLRIFCMGIAVGDIDRDGDFDYYFTNLGRNVLLRNDGAAFTDVTDATGTGVVHDPLTFPPLLAVSWGAGFHDFDNDGWLDLYVSNGHIPAVMSNGDATPNTLFRQDGGASTFQETGGELDRGVGRGVAFGDFDGDGDVDVLQSNVDGFVRLLRNDSSIPGSAGHHWLRVELDGRLGNRDAIGARVDAAVDGYVVCREVRRNDSFQASSDPRLSFGLGAHAEVRALEVRWPSGVRQQLFDQPADRALRLLEPTVTVDAARVDAIPLPALGTLLVFRAEMRNETDAGTLAWSAPQIRTTDPAGRTSPAWTGGLRAVQLPAGGTHTLVDVHLLPHGATLPNPARIRHVWVTADRELAVDEAATTLPAP